MRTLIIIVALLALLVGCDSTSSPFGVAPSELGIGLQSSDLRGTSDYHQLPSRYYSDIGISGYRHEGLNRLHNVLREFRQTSWSSLYERGVFDCSNMSGFLHDYLESEGFNVYILGAEITGRDWASALDLELDKLFGLSRGGKRYHAWLAIEINSGEYVAIEPTIPIETWYYGAYKYQCAAADGGDAKRQWGSSEFEYYGLPQVDAIIAQLD